MWPFLPKTGRFYSSPRKVYDINYRFGEMGKACMYILCTGN